MNQRIDSIRIMYGNILQLESTHKDHRGIRIDFKSRFLQRLAVKHSKAPSIEGTQVHQLLLIQITTIAP